MNLSALNRGLSRFAASLAFSALALQAGAAGLDDDIDQIQQEWAVIQYKVPEAQRVDRFTSLAQQAHAVTQANPQRAQAHVWEGIVLSSLAGAKGGLGALGIVKQAKAEYEAAIQIDPNTLSGSALNSLAVLYYKVPGWPVGFGDNAKAEQLFKQALAVNPDGIDPNYFYADYLVYRERYADALPYLEKSLKAPPRAGREVADAGRREEARALLEKVKAKLGG